MQHRDLKFGITGDILKEMQSRGNGHASGIGHLQTNGLQTSAIDYEEMISTKHCREAKDWLADKPHQLESGMHKNLAEATGDIEFEEPIGKTTNARSAPDSPSYTSSKSVAGMQIPMCLQLPTQTMEMLQTAMRNPPVTVSTLGELNLGWMMHYINLRCDINFDHDLHFTPIKGMRGDEKRSQAMDYWIALEAEFRIYQHPIRRCTACEAFGTRSLGTFQPRLSTMFQDLKDLLETLVPDKDHDQVATNLDIDLITQQVEKGVLDVGRLSRWLAKLLKTHCAPMRDESAEAMAEKLEFGANNGDLETLINGLESLFGFLEAMKLDVANHQIRTFRYILIEETVAFQQSHFRRRIADGRLNLADTEAWYADAYAQHISQISLDTQRTKDSGTLHFDAFLSGLVALCGSSAPSPPISLQYDALRIQQLRADVQDLVILQLCTSVFNALLSRLGCVTPVPTRTYLTLQSRLLTIADPDNDHVAENDDEDSQGSIPWAIRCAALATELTRAAFEVSAFPRPVAYIPAAAFEDTNARLAGVFEECYAVVEGEVLGRLAEEAGRHAGVFGKMSTKGD